MLQSFDFEKRLAGGVTNSESVLVTQEKGLNDRCYIINNEQ